MPLWSQENWRLIARSFDHMKAVGCRNVYVPLLCRTNFGNEESMVRWIRKDDGTYEHDFTLMDRYLDAAEKHLGRPKMVTFQVWELYLSARSLKRSVHHGMREKALAGRQALSGMGPRVTLFDPATGKTEPHYLPRFEDPASRALWQPLFDELHRRMAKRGLEKAMMIGMLSDVWPSREEAAFLHEVSGGLPWAVHAHPNRLRGRPATGNALLHKIADVGYEAHVYQLAFQVNPDKGRSYGWRRPELTCRFSRGGAPNAASFLGMRLLQEFNITGGQRGIGRLGADTWYVIRDNRGQRAGAVYHRYPEVCWRNLDIDCWMLAPGPDGALGTGRLENLREGLQECEARIFIERALLDAAQRQRLGDELAARCEALLNERQRAMWRTIWTVDEDRAVIDEATGGRGPTEGLWKAMEKAGKPLPGYWDGKARKMRSDEAAKGKAWFATSGWQQRNEQLFTLAGEVGRKLGPAATRPSR